MSIKTLLRGCAGALLLVAGFIAPAQAAVAAKATYAITLSGTHVATVDFDLSDDGARYSLKVNAKITGLAQLVASGIARIESAGISTGTGLTSEQFNLLTRAQGEDFTVAVTYANKQVTAFKVEPPLINNIDRVAIERKHLSNVNDMVAAFVLKGGGLDAKLCDRKMQVFTGLERFNLAFRFTKEDVATSKRTGYQGPVILCNVRYTPVSGHFTTSEMTKFLEESDRILLWYAPLSEPEYFIPYRVLITTSVGDLSMVLTDLTQ